MNDLTTPLGQRNTVSIGITVCTGIRVSECASIKLRDIDFSLQTLLYMGKGKKNDMFHLVVMPRTLLEYI